VTSRGKRVALPAVTLAVAFAAALLVTTGSASVSQDSCTTPSFQNGIDVVFGRAKTQAAADRITQRAQAVGFKDTKTVRDTCAQWKSALRGLDSYDTAVGVQTEARRVKLFPTVECVLQQEIGQLQAIFGTRRTLADLQAVVSQAASFGYVGLKTKRAPCGGYQAYIAGFKSRAEADSFAQTASQRSGLKVFIIKA
jgi:hypothetical protein